MQATGAFLLDKPVHVQVEHELGSKWLIINSGNYQAEVNKYKNLKRSLSKRSEKQAEIRDNTAMMLNSGFHMYDYHLSSLSARTVSWDGPCALRHPVLQVIGSYRHGCHADYAMQMHDWVLAMQPCRRMAI